MLLKRYAGRGLIRNPSGGTKEKHFLLIMYTLVAATAPLTSQTTVFVMYFGLLGAQAEKELCGGRHKHVFQSWYSHCGFSTLFKTVQNNMHSYVDESACFFFIYYIDSRCGLSTPFEISMLLPAA